MGQIGRLITAMVTPYTPSGEVDYEMARRLAVSLIHSGSDGLVVTGTTGESPSLDHNEKIRLWAEVKEAVGKQADVIAGAGTYSTRESIALTQEAERVGVDGILLVVPYYNKPTQEGLYQHFKAIADQTSLPCIPYNVPSRTIVNMTAETTIRLSKIPNIIGIKEASGDFDQIANIIRGASEEFLVWSGNDSDTFGVMCLGGYGVVSVASHLIGSQIKTLISSIINGDIPWASQEHKRQLPLAKGLFIVSNPIPVKYSLNLVGFNVGGFRLPLTDPDEATRHFLDELIAQYQVDLPLTASV